MYQVPFFSFYPRRWKNFRIAELPLGSGSTLVSCWAFFLRLSQSQPASYEARSADVASQVERRVIPHVTRHQETAPHILDRHVPI
jgi:hypothetical protein